jgi:hypothetical protein
MANTATERPTLIKSTEISDFEKNAIKFDLFKYVLSSVGFADIERKALRS